MKISGGSSKAKKGKKKKLNWNFQRGSARVFPSVGEVSIFSGTIYIVYIVYNSMLIKKVTQNLSNTVVCILNVFIHCNQCGLSHTISTPICIRSVFFLHN